MAHRDIAAELLKAISKAVNQAQSERRTDLAIYIQPDAWAAMAQYATYQADTEYGKSPMSILNTDSGPTLYGYEVAIITRQNGKRCEHSYVAIVGQISSEWAIGIGSDCLLTRLW